ncbi:MAG: phosphoribosylanthranilate isomerase [bacterium]
MIVQIYEVSNPTEAKKLVEIGVDHIGVLVGKGKYPRELPVEEASVIFQLVPSSTKKVVLSLSNDLEEISEIVEQLNPDILHLGISEEILPLSKVKEIREKYPDLKIMRSIAVVDEESVKLAEQYEEIVDYLLLDTLKSQLGATGETHNWDISQKIVEAVKIPVILAGGLGSDNVAEAIRKVKPAGVDSKTKTDKTGSHEKDIDKVKEFIKIAKSF